MIYKAFSTFPKKPTNKKTPTLTSRRAAQKEERVPATFPKQLVDLGSAQVHVEVHLEAQFAQGAVELLGILLGPWSPPQTHAGVKLSH